MDKLCSRPLITFTEQAGVLEAMQLMRQHGIRRLPVVNADGVLVGIVTTDDLVELSRGARRAFQGAYQGAIA